MVEQPGIIAFTKCYHSQPSPAAVNVSTSACSLCEIDRKFEEMDEEFDEALKALKIKMEKENQITVHFINNDYVGLSATMSVKMYNKHKQFIIFLQFFTRIIITIIVSTIIIIIGYLFLFNVLK
jgi:hypothetical protein